MKRPLWTKFAENTPRMWNAIVGPFYLSVVGGRGHAELSEYDPGFGGCVGETLWTGTLPTPCDVFDLMLLAEAELERRQRIAETAIPEL